MDVLLDDAGDATLDVAGVDGVDYVPLGRAAREYGVPRSTLRGRFARGLLDGTKVDGQIHLSRASLDVAMSRYRPRLVADTELSHPEPYRPPSPPPASDLSAFHAMLLRLDALHEELRRSERENQMLRVELIRYRLALEQSERSVPDSNGFLRAQLEQHDEARRRAEEAAAADAEARRQAEVAAATDAEARRRAEKAAAVARHEAEEEARRRIEEARLEAQQARDEAQRAERVMAALARENDKLLQSQPPRRRVATPWWRKLLG